jgi:hypothetical protein
MSARVKQAATTRMLCHLASPARALTQLCPYISSGNENVAIMAGRQAALTLQPLKNPLFSKARKVGEGLKTDLA